MGGRAVWFILLLASASLSGCLDPFRPEVDPALVAGSDHEWSITRSPQTDGGFFGPNIVETEYRFDPEESGAPFPGMLVLFGVRGASRPEPAELLQRMRDRMDELLGEQGVTIDPRQDREGQRDLANGASTQWFMRVGSSQPSSALFSAEEEVRVAGEAWYDAKSSTTIIAVAMAQTTGTSGLIPQQTRDHTVWDELIGDPSGSIAGSIQANGFLYNTVSHD